MAEFGVWPTLTPTIMVAADPLDGCSPLYNNDVQGKAVLVTRGNCTILQKATNVQLAGGVTVISANHEPSIFRAGVEPRYVTMWVMSSWWWW